MIDSGVIADYLASRDYVDHTKVMYRGVLRRFLLAADPDLDRWERRAVAYKQTLLDDGLAPASVALHLCVCRRFLAWCVRHGLASSNPMEDVHIRAGGYGRARRRSLTVEEVRVLLAKASEDRSGLGRRDYAILMLMLYTGLRSQSVVWIDLDDLRVVKNDVVLRYRSKGRSGKDREIIVPGPAMEAIKDYLEATGGAPSHAGALFRAGSQTNRAKWSRMCDRQLKRIVTQRLKDAGLHSDEVTAHSLRHTFASHAIAAGATLREVQEALGHEQITTTERYVHSLDRERERAAERRVDYGERRK